METADESDEVMNQQPNNNNSEAEGGEVESNNSAER
jgi:hypothetical protein